MINKAKIYKPKVKKEATKKVDETIVENRKKIDDKVSSMAKEYGGRSKEKGLEPTRYDDWELKGRCIDF